MIPTILKGCTSQQIALALPADFDPAGWKLHVSFNGVTRSFGELAAGGTVNLSFSAEETSGFPLGTARVFFILSDTAGNVTALPWAKIKVTDSRDEYAASVGSSTLPVEIKDALIGVTALPSRWNESDIRSKINEIIARLGGAVAALVLALSASAASVNLQTAPKGAIYNDEQIVTNATFDAAGLATPGDIATATNAALQAAKEYADGAITAAGAVTPEAVTNIVNDIAPAPGNYNAVSNRAMNAQQKGDALELTGINPYGEEYGYKLGPDGGFPFDSEYGWSSYESFYFPLDFVNSGSDWNWSQIFDDQDDPDRYAATLVRHADMHIAKQEIYNAIGNSGYLTAETDPSVPSWAKSSNPPAETDPTVPSWAKSPTPPVMSLEPATNYAAEVAQAATNYTDTANAETRAIVATWEAYIGGTNVVFAITNYISGSYPLDDGKLKIHELRDGAYRELYDSHTDITNHLAEFKANDMVPALSALSNSVETALADVPDKAWGRYTSAGEENEMTNAVWISHPETVFGGGTEWKRVAVGEGSVCFLTTSGNQVYTAGEEGKFYFSDWGYTNKFGFATTASFTIGIDPDSIQVDSSQIVAIGFDVTMTGVPVIWYAPAIEGAPVWEQLNNPDGSPVAGASHVVSFDTQTTPGWIYAFVNCANEDRGFFRAAIEQEGGASLFSTMPIDPQGGILCTNGINKVGIDWNNGQPRLVPWRN